MLGGYRESASNSSSLRLQELPARSFLLRRIMEATQIENRSIPGSLDSSTRKAGMKPDVSCTWATS